MVPWMTYCTGQHATLHLHCNFLEISHIHHHSLKWFNSRPHTTAREKDRHDRHFWKHWFKYRHFRYIIFSPYVFSTFDWSFLPYLYLLAWQYFCFQVGIQSELTEQVLSQTQKLQVENVPPVDQTWPFYIDMLFQCFDVVFKHFGCVFQRNIYFRLSDFFFNDLPTIKRYIIGVFCRRTVGIFTATVSIRWRI